jgi:hypothetical protein
MELPPRLPFETVQASGEAAGPPAPPPYVWDVYEQLETLGEGAYG